MKLKNNSLEIIGKYTKSKVILSAIENCNESVYFEFLEKKLQSIKLYDYKYLPIVEDHFRLLELGKKYDVDISVENLDNEKFLRAFLLHCKRLGSFEVAHDSLCGLVNKSSLPDTYRDEKANGKYADVLINFTGAYYSFYKGKVSLFNVMKVDLLKYLKETIVELFMWAFGSTEAEKLTIEFLEKEHGVFVYINHPDVNKSNIIFIWCSNDEIRSGELKNYINTIIIPSVNANEQLASFMEMKIFYA